MALHIQTSIACPLIFILVSSFLVRDCLGTPAPNFATSLDVSANSETATGAELILSTASGTSLSAAVATCDPVCDSPMPMYDASAVAEEVKITLSGLTPATHYLISVDPTTITNDNAGDPDAPTDANVCTKGAPLDLTIGDTTMDSIDVSWTVPTEGTVPSQYKLYIGTEMIDTILAADVGTGTFTFEASDAMGTALMADMDYDCKIVADIPAFGTVGSEECPATTVEDIVDCKATASSTAIFASNFALLGLLIMKLAA